MSNDCIHVVNKGNRDAGINSTGELEVGTFLAHHKEWAWTTFTSYETEEIRKALIKTHKRRKNL